MRYKLITVEGNIGAGKTTLSKMLADHYQAQLVLEQFAENPFLPKFYDRPEQYAFPLELSFLAERFQQLKKQTINHDLFNSGIVSDYLFIKSKLFAKVNLEPDEYKLYETLFNIIQPNLPQPELLVFLHAPVSKLKKNISDRNRVYEKNIPDTYLEKIQDAYTNYLKSDPFITLMIDTRETDFLHNPTHFEQLLAYLDKEYAKGKHYLSFI